MRASECGDRDDERAQHQRALRRALRGPEERLAGSRHRLARGLARNGTRRLRRQGPADAEERGVEVYEPGSSRAARLGACGRGQERSQCGISSLAPAGQDARPSPRFRQWPAAPRPLGARPAPRGRRPDEPRFRARRGTGAPRRASLQLGGARGTAHARAQYGADGGRLRPPPRARGCARTSPRAPLRGTSGG